MNVCARLGNEDLSIVEFVNNNGDMRIISYEDENLQNIRLHTWNFIREEFRIIKVVACEHKKIWMHARVYNKRKKKSKYARIQFFSKGMGSNAI